jgi:Fervidolysin N-terminal prodomain
MSSARTMQVALLLVLVVACTEQRRWAGTGGDTEIHTMEIKVGAAGGEERRYDPGEVLIRFRDGTDEGTIARIQKEMELVTIRVVSSPNLYLMKIVGDTSVEEAVQRLQRYGEVIFAEPNYQRRIESKKGHE